MKSEAPEAESEEAARAFFEAQRWPLGVTCAHCGGGGRTYPLRSRAESVHTLGQGVYKCGVCRRRFTVKVGTIFHGSHITLQQWLSGIRLMLAAAGVISVLK